MVISRFFKPYAGILLKRAFHNTAPDVVAKEFKNGEKAYRGYARRKRHQIDYDSEHGKTQTKITWKDIENHVYKNNGPGTSITINPEIARIFAGSYGCVDTIDLSKCGNVIDVTKTIGCDKFDEKELLVDGITRDAVIQTEEVNGTVRTIHLNPHYKRASK